MALAHEPAYASSLAHYSLREWFMRKSTTVSPTATSTGAPPEEEADALIRGMIATIGPSCATSSV